MGRRALVRLLVAREGTTAVEYAVLVGLVLLACISGINALGRSIAQPVQNASQQIKAAGGVTVKGSGATVKRSRGAAAPPASPERARRADRRQEGAGR